MTTDSSGWLHAIANLGVIEKQREQAKRIKNYWSLAAAWFVWDQIKDVGPSLCPAFIEKAMNDFTQCQDPDAEMGDRKEPTVQGEKNNRGKFSQFDRVRVKFGANRGHYGTIVYVGGDDGTYYGVKLDCEKNAIGYSEYELERDDKPETC